MKMDERLVVGRSPKGAVVLILVFYSFQLRHPSSLGALGLDFEDIISQ